MLSTLPASLLSLDFTSLSITFSQGSPTISWDAVAGVPDDADAVPILYRGILLSKSGYWFIIFVLLWLYSGLSNSEGSGAFSFSNLSFISSFVRETHRLPPSYPCMWYLGIK